jgi:hypothetical protein
MRLAVAPSPGRSSNARRHGGAHGDAWEDCAPIYNRFAGGTCRWGERGRPIGRGPGPTARSQAPWVA